MEPRWEAEEEALPKKRDPGEVERGKAKRAGEGAGAAGIAPLAEGGGGGGGSSPPASCPAEERMPEEGESQGRGDSSNGAVRRQRPNGCSKAAGQEEEEGGSAEQGARPTRAGWAPGEDARLTAPGQEGVMFKRRAVEDFQPIGSEEALMGELSEMVHKVVKNSSWWERHGVDDTIIALNLLSLPLGKEGVPHRTPVGPRWVAGRAPSFHLGFCSVHGEIHSVIKLPTTRWVLLGSGDRLSLFLEKARIKCVPGYHTERHV